jgi:hypothetical protein
MINFGAFLTSLPMMVSGMLGIFIVMIIISLIVMLLNKVG